MDELYIVEEAACWERKFMLFKVYLSLYSWNVPVLQEIGHFESTGVVKITIRSWAVLRYAMTTQRNLVKSLAFQWLSNPGSLRTIVLAGFASEVAIILFMRTYKVQMYKSE